VVAKTLTNPGSERAGATRPVMPEHQDALLLRHLASTTFIICLQLEADGRNCASKRAHSNNKSVPRIPPGGLNGTSWRMLTRDADRDTLPYVLAVQLDTEHTPEAIGRGAENGDQAE